MLAQGSNSGPSSTLSLKLFASPTVHSPGSALLHLEQISTFLSSLITEHKEGKPDALPVLSLERFPEAQRAADNAHPPALEKGAGPGGIKEERFESQFERNAIERPDEIALDFRFSVGDGIGQDVPSNVRWTYAELDHRATLLRNEIWARGVGSVAHEHGDGGDQIVALCLEKSPETYLAILAVLKASSIFPKIKVRLFITDLRSISLDSRLAPRGAQSIQTGPQPGALRYSQSRAPKLCWLPEMPSAQA